MAGGTALGLLGPWLLGARRNPAAVAAVVDPARCHFCSQCAQDCPFDAITLVPRADQSRFASQAYVNPAKCVGCGVCGDIEGGFTAFDLERWRRRLPGYQVHAVPQASWIQPKFVERLLAAGAVGVLIVRDSRGEMWSRDGGRWVADRLQRIREPRFRPERAGGDRWRVVDFTGANSSAVAREVVTFRHDGSRGLAQSRPSRPAILFGLLLLGLSLGVATVAPSHLRVDNPAPGHPEFVFSFRAFGDWLEPGEVDAAAEAARPVHMRGRPTTKLERAPVIVRLSVDGVVQERVFQAKGIGRDGPAIDQWRIPLEPGERSVEVTLTTGTDSEPLNWSATINAEVRRLHVVTYSPQEGFRLE